MRRATAWQSLAVLATALVVLEAERAGARYGLRLPALEIAPDHGDEQRSRCLAALALHGVSP